MRCNFYLGAPGCDNAFAYLFNQFGYKLYNEPTIIKTYHYHTKESRSNYTVSRVILPYLCIEPIIKKSEEIKPEEK